MLTIDPQDVSTGKLHMHMLGAVAPRPIAFASTLDKDGTPNLAPFSFSNAFSSNPPILVFSPTRSVRSNVTKDTLENVKEVDEVVINVVTYNMVHQTHLASMPFPKDINEFEKAGFTPIPSERVKPFRVKESPVQFECKVRQVIELGKEGGSGNLVICEILLMHISEDILDEDSRIDANKIDLVGRMAGKLYSRASGDAIFTVEAPGSAIGIGIDQIPDNIRSSKVLDGNDLGKLGWVESLPADDDVNAMRSEPEIVTLMDNSSDSESLRSALHQLAKKKLEDGNIEDAWKILLLK